MKAAIILLVILCPWYSNSQNITIDELVSLRKKSLVTVEEALTAKGWSYINGKSPDYLKLGSATFAFKKSSFDDKAQSFITYYYSEDSSEKKLTIQLFNKDKYAAFLARIKALGCKLKNSEISDGAILKIYQGATTTFEIRVSTQVEEFSSATKTFYYFTISDNKIYNYSDFIVTDTMAVETTTEYNIVSEEVIPVEDDRVVSGESFFVGTWVFPSYTIKFDVNGTCVLTDSKMKVSLNSWQFINNRLLLGTDMTFFIKNQYSDSFMYSSSIDGLVHYAYKRI